MSTITRERLQEVIDGDILFTDEQRELARIALASLEAEAVTNEIVIPEPMTHRSISEICPPGVNQTLFASGWNASRKSGMNSGRIPPIVKGIDAECVGWNACRAAMLQGAEPVTMAYKLPANTPCKDAPEHIWLQTAGVWPENGEFSELTWCSDNQHPDDTLYVRADVVAGNSPVIPDWQAEAEKMSELHGSSFVVFRNGESPQCADPSKVIISFSDKGLGHESAPQQDGKAALEHGMQRYAGAMQKLSEGDK